jgi:hypothetical protein
MSQLQTAVGKGYNVVVYAFYDVDAKGNLIQDRMYMVTKGFQYPQLYA